MKKHIITAIVCTFAALALSAAPKPQTLTSPDGRIVVTVDKFNYSVSADGKQLLAPSAISMTLAGGTVYGGDAKLVKTLRKTVDRTVPTNIYKKSEVRENYNELTLVYKAFNLVFRAYDDAVAYRFVSRSATDFIVESETAEFAFPGDWKAFVPYTNNPRTGLPVEKLMECSFENTYEHIALSEWDKARPAFLPLVVEAPCGYKLAITEADLFSFPGLGIANVNGDNVLEGIHAKYPKDIIQGGHNELQGIIIASENFIAKASAGQAFPWRAIQIAREDKELASSDMVFRLATPAAEGDWSWVKPGKVAWDWWNDWNLYGVDFRAGINNDTYKYYIDFASANGIEYVILDEGWAVNKKADLFQVIPEIDLEELCAYAGKKDVGIVLWAGYWAVKRDMEHVFSHFSKMGVKGFKIDFMDRDDAPMVDFYTECAKMGAKYHMMCDFHGAYKPTGLQRTYPNVINFEGVNGLEQMKWEVSTKQVEYDVTIPFIRMVAGPMDYTQGAMRNATKENYRPVNSEAMSPGTRCHQLAMYVVLESPFNMLCDSPSNYLAEPECTKVIADMPVTWDRTIALDGKIGDYVATAREKDGKWYVGALTDWDAREITLDFSFLPEGSYTMTVFKDGINADRAARDYKKETVTVRSGDKVAVRMAPGGGWLATISK